ncbi:MAG: iron-only hydrogenase system regulator [Clostridiales bacterium]|nr:iron-only hydrogenase system regulator [Clostridiales bacterium]
MQQRVAVIGVIVENKSSIDELNHIISEYSEYIVGRMGIPYHKRGISIICLSVDAPQDKISALSGKIGKLEGISAKTAYSNAVFEDV